MKVNGGHQVKKREIYWSSEEGEKNDYFRMVQEERGRDWKRREGTSRS